MHKYLLIYTLFLISSIQTSLAQVENLFPFPQVPAMLIEPQQRAAWLLEHYWDNIDFSDTDIINNAEFIEQAFVNFLSIIPIVNNSSDIEKGINTLMDKASKNKNSYKSIIALSEKYLYEPNSPFYNETHYIPFLHHINSTSTLSYIEKTHTKYQYEVIKKNRPGQKATDIYFTTREGNKSNLYSIVADEIILIFYDPTCNHCAEIIDKLSKNEKINHRITTGQTRIIAVYPDGNKSTWIQHTQKMPQHWIVAIGAEPIQPVGKYILRAMPTIYLLDKEKKVIAKDINIENL